MGPIQFVAIEFPGNQFKGEVIPELREVVDKGLIRIIDLVFIKKDRHGNVSTFELENTDEETVGQFSPLTSDITGMLSEEDLEKVAAEVNNNSSVALFLFEHAWAARFKEAVMRANGQVVVDYRVPDETAEMAFETAGSAG